MEQETARSLRSDVRLNQVSHATGDVRFKLNQLPWQSRAENFCTSNRREFQPSERRNCRITLRDDPGELRAGFHEQNARHDWVAGEMSA